MNGDDEEVSHVWSETNRFVPRVFIQPAQEFIQVEAAGGLVLLGAAVVAFIWANSPWSAGYEALWNTRIGFNLGELVQLDHLTLREWISDGAMAVFFFVVGLEIKRELIHGELREPRAAALPAIAALGGMIVPAVIFLVFNAGTGSSHGWGVPMATDIAFAVGVISLLGTRVPSGAKLFLLTLAIVDDLGAIVVIAIFYTKSLEINWLVVALILVGLAANLRRINVRSLVPYVCLGVVSWYALHESGVHTTLVGVAFGFITPAWSFYNPKRFAPEARRLVGEIEKVFDDDRLDHQEHERIGLSLDEIRRLATETQSPLERLEKRLNPWVSFFIIPLFALANAGISLSGVSISGIFGDRVVLGVFLGLIIGKTAGIFAATWLVCRLGFGVLPERTSWSTMLGVSICAGVGFTVAIFVANLSFTEQKLVESAKLGVLAASIFAGFVGYIWLRFSPSSSKVNS